MSDAGIAGAHYGESAIPREWRDQLALVSSIDRYANSLGTASRREIEGGSLGHVASDRVEAE